MTLMGVDPRHRGGGSGGPASEVSRLVREGAARRKARDFAAAVDRYLRVLAADPAHLGALRGLAESYRGTGEAERCLEAWDRYLSVRPGEGEVQTRAGDACRKAGRTARAAAHYEAALRHDPGDRYALMGLGDLHQKERRPEAALACWERLLVLDPDLLNIRTMAGNLCRRKLDFGRAEQHFRAALRLAPHNAPATFGLADALRGQGRFEEAYPFWIEMIALDPENPQVLCRAGDCFARLGRLEEASGLFLRVLEGGYDRSALLGLARVHILRQALEEAVRCCEAILGRNPGDGRASALRAQVL